MADQFVGVARDVATVIQDLGVRLRWHSRRDPVDVLRNASAGSLTYLVYVVFPTSDMSKLIVDLIGSGVTDTGNKALMAAHGLPFTPRVNDHLERDNNNLHVSDLSLIRPAITPILWTIKLGELDG